MLDCQRKPITSFISQQNDCLDETMLLKASDESTLKDRTSANSSPHSRASSVSNNNKDSDNKLINSDNSEQLEQLAGMQFPALFTAMSNFLIIYIHIF